MGDTCVADSSASESMDAGQEAAQLRDAGNEGFDAGSEGNGGYDVSPWLLSVNSGERKLIKIDTETGATKTVCEFTGTDFNYPSTTFGIDGTLYGWNGYNDTLDVIDPCTCETTERGQTADSAGLLYTNVPGITADGNKVETLFGLSTDQDKLLTIATENGAVTPVGDLGLDFHYSGTTWSIDLEGLYAVNNLTDKLYVLDTVTGLATDIADLDIDVHLVGIEFHIGTRELYLCTNAGTASNSSLYSINVDTGETNRIGDLGYGCNNLAAPWTPLECIDDLEFD